MASNPKILLLDDDPGFLEVYREMLGKHLTCLPDVKVATSGTRGLALLESEHFNLLIVDLNMPKMDGLQVLSIARRKFPHLRLVVLTAMRDEQFRTRAYAMGVDQYWIKPESDQELGLFMESIESLLSREVAGGFRGVQSKSLVDLIQLECLSQSSSLLKITHGIVEGRIWIQNGEVIDAEAAGLTAEPAFQRILSWKTGSFEILPGAPERPRTIFTSYQGLLLNTAQALDEAASQEPAAGGGNGTLGEVPTSAAMVLSELSQLCDVEFVLAAGVGANPVLDHYGLDNAKPVADWMRQSLEGFQGLGERLQVGALQQIVGTGPHRKLAVAPCKSANLCVGFPPTLPAENLRETMRTVLTRWAS